MSASSDTQAWLARAASRVIETSCAWVFLTETGLALKLKKPVDYGFLDFTTPEKRRWAIERELAFNRATAPGIYRRVRQVNRAADGSLSLDGEGEAVDFVLEMRAFDPDAVLCEHPNRVTGDLGEALGRTIARFHAGAEPRPHGGGVWALGYTIGANADHLRAAADRLGRDETERIIAGADHAFAEAGPLLDARSAEGFARRCHGDLHLGNILLEEGRPVLFDCIEFNDRLSDIDVLYDVGFLMMDLAHRGRPEAANRVLNGWLDEAARSLPQTIWDGLAVLPLMLAARAAVRAHVTASEGSVGAARSYLETAASHLRPRRRPALLAIGGLSGSGKTTLARRLGPGLGGPPGAVVLRSDEIRKRMAGARPTDVLGADAHGPAMDRRVYDEMGDVARRVLAAGTSVVLDATFLDPARRAAAEALALQAGVPFHGAWLAGDPEQLRARLAQRAGDASDADAAVLERQMARPAGTIDWEVLSATDLDAAAARLRARFSPANAHGAARGRG